MNKRKQQGTSWETECVNRANKHGMRAHRLAEGGPNDIGDVEIPTVDPGIRKIPAVAWKRLTDQGKGRRQPDGEKEVVIITMDDFMELIFFSGFGAILECKATERLNVTRTLHKARKKVEANQ